jgi:hypothetical protein
MKNQRRAFRGGEFLHRSNVKRVISRQPCLREPAHEVGTGGRNQRHPTTPGEFDRDRELGPAGKGLRDLPLRGRKNADSEVHARLQHATHPCPVTDAYQDEGRIERDRREGIRRHAVFAALVRRSDDNHTRRKPAECLSKLARIDHDSDSAYRVEEALCRSRIGNVREQRRRMVETVHKPVRHLGSGLARL